jgi:acyl-CoA thioester hydrolase
MENPLKGYPVIVELPVVWGEMDALQHVNNVVYFRYFETARIAYFDKARIWLTLDQTGIGPILASTWCRYKAPLTYPDTVLAATKTIRIEKDRFTMQHVIFSRKLEKVAAEGEGVLVTYDYRNKVKTSVPEQLKQYIIEAEGGNVEVDAV